MNKTANPCHQLLSLAISLSLCLFSPAVSMAQSNYAVNYDGANDYISLPASVAVSQLNTFTVEAWVYWNGAGNGCIYSETIQGNNNPMFSIIPRSVDGGGIELTFRDNSFTGLILQPATATITANRWVHVAVVRTSATSMKIYIDGVLKDDVTFTAPASWTPDKVNIGLRWRAAQTDPFGGKIDEVRIWNTARTQAEIKANMFNKNLANNASGLLAYYRFTEGSGATTANSCTNTSGIDGTLTNGPTWTASPIQFGANALHFDQADDRVIAPVPTTATGNVTMEAWVYHEGGTGTDHLIMVNGVMGTNGYALFVNTSHQLIVIFNGVNTWNTGVSLSAGQWTHLALVITPPGFILYKNGVNIYSNTGSPLAPTTNFIIGFNTVAAGQPFDGYIDEVRVWNTARTQTEIQDNMNKEIDPSAAGLAAYYTFNQGIASGDNAGLITLIDQSGSNNGTLNNFALSGGSSNFVSQNSSLFVLPLQWLSFNVQPGDGKALLQWSTAGEQNTKDFIIQRSNDGLSWNDIGSIAAAGNSTIINHYSYTDANPGNGAIFYRIRQEDRDGRYSYSKIVSANFFLQQAAFTVVSNPVTNGILQLQVHTASVITIYNTAGSVLLKQRLAEGPATINLSSYPKGLYWLQAGGYTEKVLLQ